MGLKKSILKVFSANFIQLITGIIVTFFVPSVVSIDNYSSIKTYTLYTGYVALFSMGFYDGIYLKYGGKDPTTLNKNEMRQEHVLFLLTQCAWTILWCIIGLILHNDIIVYFALTLLPANYFTYYKRIYLAVGQFDQYKNGMMIYSISYMVLNCLFAIVLRIDSPLPYYLCAIIANILAVIYNLHFFNSYYGLKTNLAAINTKLIPDNIKLGWLILFGNLAVSTIYSIDRWFVKFSYSDASFAYYSFAVSMLNIIMVLVQAIALSLYNYLAKDKNKEQIKLINTVLLAIGTAASSGYFVLVYIIRYFLPSYSDSLGIIAVSFAAYPYMILINSIYLNLYKADKNDKGYIKSVVFMVIISCILNTIALAFRSTTLPIAIATTVSFVLWYIFCCRDFGFEYNLKFEIFYLPVMLIAFILLTFFDVKILGLIIYLAVWIIMSILFFKINKVKIANLIKSK